MARTYVELVEDDGVVGPDDERRPGLVDVVRRHPRRAAVTAAAVVVVAVTAVLGQVVVDAREQARLARLADVPGVLRPVDLPLHTLYVADGDAASAVQGGVRAGDLLVGGTYRPVQSAPHVVAVDRRTGDIAWDVTVDLPPAADPAPDVHGDGPDPSASAWCSDVDGPPSRLACVVSRAYGWQMSAEGYGREVATRGLVVLDATDGTVLARRDEPLGAEIAAGRDGYWVTTVDDDRRGVEVVARAFDGSEQWSTHVDTSGIPQQQTPYVLHDKERTVLDVGTQAWVLGPDGSAVAELGRGGLNGGMTLVPGGVLVESYTSNGMPDGAVIWRDDGTKVDLGGDRQLYLTVDDGSRPDAFFLTAGDTGPLVRRDWSGKELWRADVTVGSTAVLLDGTLVAVGGDRLAAVDADTGAVRWRTDMPRPADQVFTDGRVLLVLSGRVVRAYGVDDGTLQWSAALVEDGGSTVLERTATDTPTTDAGVAGTGGPDEGWWFVTTDGHLAFSSATESSGIVVLG